MIQIPAQDLYFRRVNDQLGTDLDIALAERGTVEWSRVRQDRATVTLANQRANTSASLIRMHQSWTLNPGTSTVRLIVRDRFTGRYGVLDMPLENLRTR